MKYRFLLVSIVLLIIGCEEGSHSSKQQEVSASDSRRSELIYDSLVNLHSALNPPKKGDWLSSHPEKGENFSSYVKKWPQTPSEERSILYLVKLSDFDSTQQEMFSLTKDYLEIFYQTSVDTISIPIDYNAIPENYFRYNDHEEVQVLTDFFLKQKLLKALPDDAWGMIGCTAMDIYPDPKWNFVFGQASLNNRVGVWSMRRLGDPEEYPDMRDKSFMRNLKVATHETGHILSMKHCVYFDCLMNGSAHIAENDSKPPYLCPICLGKTDWNRNFDLTKRYNELFEFWTENELSIYHQYYEIVKEINLSGN